MNHLAPLLVSILAIVPHAYGYAPKSKLKKIYCLFFADKSCPGGGKFTKDVESFGSFDPNACYEIPGATPASSEEALSLVGKVGSEVFNSIVMSYVFRDVIRERTSSTVDVDEVITEGGLTGEEVSIAGLTGEGQLLLSELSVMPPEIKSAMISRYMFGSESGEPGIPVDGEICVCHDTYSYDMVAMVEKTPKRRLDTKALPGHLLGRTLKGEEIISGEELNEGMIFEIFDNTPAEAFHVTFLNTLAQQHENMWFPSYMTCLKEGEYSDDPSKFDFNCDTMCSPPASHLQVIFMYYQQAAMMMNAEMFEQVSKCDQLVPV